MSISGALAFSIYVDWFNAHGKSTQLARIGPIMLLCLDLPPKKIEARECICCMNHPLSTGANLPSIELPINGTDKGAQTAMARLPYFTHLNRSFRILYLCCHPHGHCRSQIEEICPQLHYTCSYQNHKSTIAQWLWASPQQRPETSSEYGEQYSILEDLLYLDATRMGHLNIMHNLILGILKDHAAFKLCTPESKSKIFFRSCSKSNDTNSSDSDSMTSKSCLDQITLREACSLIRESAKIINESLPTTSTQRNCLPIPTPHKQHPSSGSADISSFDVD
ncbi:hypothetical protein O181_028503 [Austropuccinia psidii MF-1]|uniref:Uncharacterized protein n=1 Tax=Austropuccinia psidii MF-1 TaxID=1389203 RepID=A0A9Q3CTX4_9BASI|nr:hypothetical protein [Austropuccinia psidii MF-1]